MCLRVKLSGENCGFNLWTIFSLKSRYSSKKSSHNDKELSLGQSASNLLSDLKLALRLYIFQAEDLEFFSFLE